MKELLYEKENNLFQGLEWATFQEGYGRKIVHFSNCYGIELELPFSRKAIWVQKAPNKLSKENFKEFKQAGVDFIRVEPSILSEEEITQRGLKKVTEKSILSGQKSPQATQLIDISGSEEEVLSNMKSKTRYNARLSIKKGVSVKSVGDESILYDLLEKTAKRQSEYNPHPRDYYQKLIEELGKSGAAKVFVAYNKDKNPIAAVLISFYGEVATYLHGGFSDKDKSLMAPYLCHVEAVKYAKAQGCKYYDMWGVAESDDPNDPWAGITRFKQGFGGEKIVFPGSYDYVNSRFWYNLLTFIARARRILK